MSLFLKEFPDRPVYFTEGSVFGLPGAQRLISLLVNGASSYNAWVTMIDDQGKPNNGPFRASNTCVMLKTNPLSAEYRLDYYLYGQFMRFIERGAIRVEVSSPDVQCPVVGFKNPDGKLVLVIVNLRKDRRAIVIEAKTRGACLYFLHGPSQPSFGCRSEWPSAPHPRRMTRGQE